jgi:hypothetical protein
LQLPTHSPDAADSSGHLFPHEPANAR